MFTHTFRMHHIVMLQGIRLYREERTIECQKKELTELFLLNSRGQEQKLCLEKIKNWKKQKSTKKSEIHAHLRAD